MNTGNGKKRRGRPKGQPNAARLLKLMPIRSLAENPQAGDLTALALARHGAYLILSRQIVPGCSVCPTINPWVHAHCPHYKEGDADCRLAMIYQRRIFAWFAQACPWLGDQDVPLIQEWILTEMALFLIDQYLAHGGVSIVDQAVDRLLNVRSRERKTKIRLADALGLTAASRKALRESDRPGDGPPSLVEIMTVPAKAQEGDSQGRGGPNDVAPVSEDYSTDREAADGDE